MTQYDYDKFVNRLFSKVVSSSQHFNYEASNHPCAVEKRAQLSRRGRGLEGSMLLELLLSLSWQAAYKA